MEMDGKQQARMVGSLLRQLGHPSAEETVDHLETHISHVLLAGDYAYKIKKPLDLGFLDFSTLERRRFCCEEELRLNSRLAPDLYLDVLPITGTLDVPSIGGEGAVLDYAVRMRRFSQSDLLSVKLPDTGMIDQIAQAVAEFHQEIPSAETASRFGTPERVIHPMLQNFEQVRGMGLDTQLLQRLEPLEAWTHAQAEQLKDLIQQRKRDGHTRECHGDMHLGNITTFEGRLQIFDGIEFNPDLRWIDTLNDIAFLIMDLQHRGMSETAARFLNRYLALTGEYQALPLLGFYQLYRAMVRAKVAAIRLGQVGLNQEEQELIRREFDSYLDLATIYTDPKTPALLITHGLSGSGKSLFSSWLAERLPMIHLRSDVERKRLFLEQGTTGKGEDLGQGIYSSDATQTTYAHLKSLAKTLLQSGYHVVVDATFLKAAQRQDFQALAGEVACPYLVLDCQASQDVLKQRVVAREHQGGDPSDADLRVLEMQITNREPLVETEVPHALAIDTGQLPSEALLTQVRQLLTQGD